MALTEEQKQRARETRAKNEATRAAKWTAEAEAINAARLALQKVFESPDATPGEVIRAAELLVALGKH